MKRSTVTIPQRAKLITTAEKAEVIYMVESSRKMDIIKCKYNVNGFIICTINKNKDKILILDKITEKNMMSTRKIVQAEPSLYAEKYLSYMYKSRLKKR